MENFYFDYIGYLYLKGNLKVYIKRHDSIIPSRITQRLKTTDLWYRKKGLNINPREYLPPARRRKFQLKSIYKRGIDGDARFQNVCACKIKNMDKGKDHMNKMLPGGDLAGVLSDSGQLSIKRIRANSVPVQTVLLGGHLGSMGTKPCITIRGNISESIFDRKLQWNLYI